MQSGIPQERFMRRAFALALHAKGSVSPNPMVGCVVVWQGRIIGEGFHRCYGQPHAEANAIHSVLSPNATVAALSRQTGKTPAQLLSESTVYVSLEPCSHYGKQPPCALKLIENKVAQVVVSCGDPNPSVNGKGMDMLRKAGIQVTEHFLEAEGRELGRRFFTNVEKKRPYIILKWAQTVDGFISADKGRSTKITGSVLQALNHSYRVQEDAIMVGTNTLLTDNSRLNARMYYGKQPIRVSFDLHGRILEHLEHSNLHFFDGQQRTILFVYEDDMPKYAGLQAKVGENLHVTALGQPFSLEECMQVLHRLHIGSLIVEGGTELLQSFIKSGLWDEARVFQSAQSMAKGYAAPELPAAIPLHSARYGRERVDIYRNKTI